MCIYKLRPLSNPSFGVDLSSVERCLRVEDDLGKLSCGLYLLPCLLVIVDPGHLQLVVVGLHVSDHTSGYSQRKPVDIDFDAPLVVTPRSPTYRAVRKGRSAWCGRR